jgi:CDP-diacylglycerol--glycerol-3-phosphate 3-phosphatidyltransferase
VNLPNVLTVLRVILTGILIYCFLQDGLGPLLIALILFTAASLTDYLDGYIARKHNLISSFGKIMDPIADKFLVLSVFFIFMRKSLIVGWMFYFIFVREVVITVLRLIAMNRGKTLAAEGAGKLKTVLQIVSVYLIIIFHISGQFLNSVQFEAASWGIFGFMLVVVFITLWSGATFILNNRKEFFHVG